MAPLLARAGVVSTHAPTPLAEALADDSRALVRTARFGDQPLELLLLKPDDVPTYVEYGAADLGVCGRDVLVEREVDVYQPVDLGIGRCRLVVAGRVGVDVASSHTGRMPRVATKYPRIAAAHFARRGVQVEIVDVQGSVELAPLVGPRRRDRRPRRDGHDARGERPRGEGGDLLASPRCSSRTVHPTSFAPRRSSPLLAALRAALVAPPA